MFKQNLIAEKAWNGGIAQFLQNGEDVEHAIGMFEVSSKNEITKNNREKI